MRTADAQEPVFFLHVLADVDLVRFVVEPELLERDADFLPVRRPRRVKDDVLCPEKLSVSWEGAVCNNWCSPLTYRLGNVSHCERKVPCLICFVDQRSSKDVLLGDCS